MVGSAKTKSSVTARSVPAPSFHPERLKAGTVEVEQSVGSDSQIDVSHHRIIEQHAEELGLAACAGWYCERAEADLVPLTS